MTNYGREAVPSHVGTKPLKPADGSDITIHIPACQMGEPHHCCRWDRYRNPFSDELSNYAIIGSDPPWCCGCGKSAAELGVEPATAVPDAAELNHQETESIMQFLHKATHE